MPAKFELESEMIAVNKGWIKYILLGHSKAAWCSAGVNKPSEVFCPVYVTNTRIL